MSLGRFHENWELIIIFFWCLFFEWMRPIFVFLSWSKVARLFTSAHWTEERLLSKLGSDTFFHLTIEVYIYWRQVRFLFSQFFTTFVILLVHGTKHAFHQMGQVYYWSTCYMFLYMYTLNVLYIYMSFTHHSFLFVQSQFISGYSNVNIGTWCAATLLNILPCTDYQ